MKTVPPAFRDRFHTHDSIWTDCYVGYNIEQHSGHASTKEFALAWLQEHDVVDVFGVEGAGPARLRIDNRTLREVDEAEAIHIAQTMLNQAMAMGAVRAFQQQNCSNWDNCFSVSLRHRSFFRTSTSQVILQVRTSGHGIRS